MKKGAFLINASRGNVVEIDAFDIIIQPPPDLVVENIIPPGPSSNKENTLFTYDRKNQGATHRGDFDPPQQGTAVHPVGNDTRRQPEHQHRYIVEGDSDADPR